MTNIVVAGTADHVANDGDALRISRQFQRIMVVHSHTQSRPDPRPPSIGTPKCSAIDHVYQYVAPGAHVLCLVSA